MTPTWTSILPPLVAILLAVFSRHVILALFLGIWTGWTLLSDLNPLLGFAAALEQLVRVFESPGNTRVILFSALVGGLIALTQRSGGVAGFVKWMQSKSLATDRRGVGLLTWFTGIFIFIESSITCLVAGSIARPMADKAKMSREKLAYLVDSTSAPVCILIPLNAWGAYVMGLLSQQGVEQPLGLLLASIPLNFYALSALTLTLLNVMTGKDFGPMRRAERRAREEGKVLDDEARPLVSEQLLSISPASKSKLRARHLILPVATLVFMMPLGLYLTGSASLEGAGKSGGVMEILGAGSGSTSVLWAVVAGILVAGLMALLEKLMSLTEVVDHVMKGAAGLVPMAVIMMLAFAINDTCGQLGTGAFVAQQTQAWLTPGLIPLVLFATGAVIAFSTGTSWGTFGIMIPIGLPLVMALDGNLALATAAILSGGIFGDHASPISDTSVISSMATSCDHMAHVRTQLPYALVAAAVASLGFLIAGFAWG